MLSTNGLPRSHLRSSIWIGHKTQSWSNRTSQFDVLVLVCGHLSSVHHTPSCVSHILHTLFTHSRAFPNLFLQDKVSKLELWKLGMDDLKWSQDHMVHLDTKSQTRHFREQDGFQVPAANTTNARIRITWKNLSSTASHSIHILYSNAQRHRLRRGLFSLVTGCAVERMGLSCVPLVMV